MNSLNGRLLELLPRTNYFGNLANEAIKSAILTCDRNPITVTRKRRNWERGVGSKVEAGQSPVKGNL